MSQLLIQHYLNELQTLRRVSGTKRESVVRDAFKALLKDWGKSCDLIFLSEHEYETLTKTRVYPDGTLMYELRVPFGYWEAKDTDDDLDEEIEKKFRKGYPQDNIIFDDTHEAVLVQNKQHVMRCGVEDPAQLHKLLELYFSYERPEIADFREAVEQFKADLPAVLKALREMIDKAERDNQAFHQAAVKFLKHAQETINPNVVAADVREMLIQHILTEEIFSQVFDNSDFHHHNNVAKQLYALEETFFAGGLKHKTLAGLRPYYAAIKSAAALVSSHHEKQTFLKVIYENFYKVYDKKKADRLGVAYTPNEIVRFMIEGADWLCQTHFGKALIDKNVEILDPCVGTGTFITEMIEHFRGQPAKLRYKYLEELLCNEVAILPYYVANLNIEATYAAIARNYEEFPNLCFVDTLDNTAALKVQKNQHFGDLFGGMSEENVARISRQNKKKISVIIGNPPYNANQLNENENNKNREYSEIDRRIKASYIAASTARKTKLYDMYARFFRWASDRVEENGIVAFVTNRSFIENRTFDGFRRTAVAEFNDIYLVDLGGDVRDDPRISGTKHNVFGIQTGVAISFMVKRAKAKGCRIRYTSRPPLETAEEKLAFLGNTKLSDIALEEINPDNKQNWLNFGNQEFDALIPIGDKEIKSVTVADQERAVFKLFSLGVSTNRDEWLIDHSGTNLKDKARWLSAVFAKVPQHEQTFLPNIKWSRNLKRRLAQGRRESFDEARVRTTLYRPFAKRYMYDSVLFIDERGSYDQIFARDNQGNMALCVLFGDRQPFSLVATSIVPNLNLYSADATVYFPLKRFANGGRTDNITDWVLNQFRAHYERGKAPKRPITKDDIFHYVYGVLHDPIYREKYALNLKREFPRIPFYTDFWKWAEWGKKLTALHVGYEKLAPWPLDRVDVPDEKSLKAGLAPKTSLKAHKDTGKIQLDSETQLTGVPPQAWGYKLGNRSALEWVLDQYKEKTPKDPTIREKFNTYRFADYKEKVIDLLQRVTRVSVETMQIVDAMRSTGMDGRTNP
jgi:predicted helicase